MGQWGQGDDASKGKVSIRLWGAGAFLEDAGDLGGGWSGSLGAGGLEGAEPPGG